MDVDDLADRLWSALRGRPREGGRVQASRDPAYTGLWLLMLPFVAFDLLSWNHTLIVVGAISVLLLARLVYLRRTSRGDRVG